MIWNFTSSNLPAELGTRQVEASTEIERCRTILRRSRSHDACLSPGEKPTSERGSFRHGGLVLRNHGEQRGQPGRRLKAIALASDHIESLRCSLKRLLDVLQAMG